MTDEDVARTANLLGAAALASADRVRAAAAEAAGTSASGAAALVTLHAGDGVGVTELARRIELSQPAAARMVDALEAQGLVERRRQSARSVRVRLTRRGRAAAGRVLESRERALTRLVSGLAREQHDALRTGLEALLGAVFAQTGSEDRVCRLCDRGVCVAGGQTCPVGQAARDRQASASS